MTHDNLDPEALEVALYAAHTAAIPVNMEVTRGNASIADMVNAAAKAAITAYLAHIRAKSLSDLAAADAVLLDTDP